VDSWSGSSADLAGDGSRIAAREGGGGRGVDEASVVSRWGGAGIVYCYGHRQLRPLRPVRSRCRLPCSRPRLLRPRGYAYAAGLGRAKAAAAGERFFFRLRHALKIIAVDAFFFFLTTTNILYYAANLHKSPPERTEIQLGPLTG
jgi:hypothetical protein